MAINRNRKTSRNPLGGIETIKVTIDGKKVTRYNARKRYTSIDGKRAQKFKRCRTHAEAMTQLRNFEAEIERELAGQSVTAVRTFCELCDYFEREYIKPPVFVGNRQIAGYRQDLKTLRTYVAEYKNFFGKVDVAKLTYEDLSRYAQHLATTPIRIGNSDKYRIPKPASINRKLAWLRRILNVGIQLDWIDKNPFKLGRRLIDPSAEEPKDRALAYDEEDRLLAACEGPDSYEYERRGKTVKAVREINPRAHLKPVIIFAIESGMRKKEIFTTRRSQVDFKQHIIELNPMQTKALKKRFIPMSDRLEAALQELFAKNPFGGKDLIFSGLKDCDRAFATACRRAGIVGLTFHGLRHTAATYMDEAGISDAARRNIIGHSSTRIAQRYVNQTADVHQASRVKLNEFHQKQEARRQTAK